MAKQGRMDRFVAFIIGHKLIVLLMILAATGAVAYGITRMKTEVILSDLFPQKHPYLQLVQRFSSVFGSGGSGVVIAVEVKEGDIFNNKTLSKVKGITEEVELMDEVYRVLTVSIASVSTKSVTTKTGGEIEVVSLMFPDPPKDEDEKGMTDLKRKIFSNPAYSGMLVSEDGKAALVLTEMKENIPYELMFKRLRDLTAKYEDANTRVHVVGFPMLMGWIYSYKAQMYLVFGISILGMILILWFSFRHLLGMLAPMAVSVICTALGLGFIGWSGINFSPLLYVLAFLVGARMVSNAVQITHRYCEEFAKTGDKAKATYLTTRAMWMPNIMAATTEMAGFMVLGVAKIALMQQLAVIMGFWMATISLEGVLVPIICSYLPFSKAAVSKDVEVEEHGPIARLCAWMAAFSLGRAGSRVVIGVVVFIIAVGGWQMTRLKVGDATPGSPILWQKDTYNKDQAYINETFRASSDNLVLFYEGTPGSIYEPEVMNTTAAFILHMAEKLPDIYKTSSSIMDISKAVHVMQRDGDPLFYMLPSDPIEMEGLFGVVRNVVGNKNLGRYVDPTLERMQTILYFSDHTSDNLRRIHDAAYGFFKEHSAKMQNGEFLLAGGRVGMEMGLNQEMKATHAWIDLLVFFAIFVMCVIAFRSFIAGIMLTAPLLLSNMIVFGYMSLMNIGLSANTLPCSAIGVGVGVDFAIYLYSRCIEEYPMYKDYRTTVMQAVRTTGEAIVFTAVTLILPLIAWYFISGLKFQAEMGFFLSILLFTNMLTCLTVHPLMLTIIKPKFMKRNLKDGAAEALPMGEKLAAN